MKYRITKYNPEFRNENGHFIMDEWTSISDIGRKFSNSILTEKEYKRAEDNYVNAVLEILKEKEISKLIVNDLEKDDEKEPVLSFEEKEIYKELKNNICVDLKKAEKIIRFVLREMLWCRLCSEFQEVKIEFGYDYYMYVSCSVIKEITKKKICESGLFVELFN